MKNVYLVLIVLILLLTLGIPLIVSFLYKKKKRPKMCVNVPLYVSLTSIHKNQHALLKTLKSITNQTIVPNKIFLYLSEEPSLLDEGFKNKKISNSKLSKFIQEHPIVSVEWGKDIGPYGKLLPLLKQKWDEDCIIITIDDDTVYVKDMIENLVNSYEKYRCLVANRGFTPSCSSLKNFNYLNRKKKKDTIGMYNFPTGKGGVLYKPQFFHKTKNLIFDRNTYLEYCKMQDDVWFYLIRILNDINCVFTFKKWMRGETLTHGLYKTFNKHNNKNTKVLKNAIKKLEEMGYTFQSKIMRKC
jgi:hypothetical protein